MKQICLYNLEQAGVVILDKAGVAYFNKSAGVADVLRVESGFFVPMSNDPPLGDAELGLVHRLRQITLNQEGLTQAHANEIDALLLEVSSTDRYKVDIERLDESNESWVYLDIVPQGEYSNFENFSSFKAVLTWPNSC